ncbi:hypothetical protein MTR67_034779 [Solanum verrucosum]|uniref:Reverse transcriptase RNase H-like domain-containing protein n=1 Tax=Solanum verrucosum TaxID=315347 RepID=A0AAF0U8Y9_SOLVR|nr:hypothetical protein MTR67_034779 [Solanum verrucosum]
MQNGKVIAYPSEQLKIHEWNYPTFDLKLVVVQFSLKIWHYYLYGLHIYMVTDDISLHYVFSYI